MRISCDPSVHFHHLMKKAHVRVAKRLETTIRQTPTQSMMVHMQREKFCLKGETKNNKRGRIRRQNSKCINRLLKNSA